jgi:hypothetical protein
LEARLACIFDKMAGLEIMVHLKKVLVEIFGIFFSCEQEIPKE